jgi:hypothetical protein
MYDPSVCVHAIFYSTKLKEEHKIKLSKKEKEVYKKVFSYKPVFLHAIF